MSKTKIYKPMKRISLGRFLYGVGLWSYGVSFDRDWARHEGHRFAVWCFKMTGLPEQGEHLRGHYKGFNWSVGILFKFDIYS